MASHEAFVRAIVENPHDDGLRLVYADWLEEQGDNERSEFIRVQVELARIFSGTPDLETQRYRQNWPNRSRELLGRVGALRRRDNELLPAHGFPPQLPFDEPTHCKWRRGFVEIISCACADWLKHGLTVVTVQPVTDVRITDKAPYPLEMADHAADLAPESRRRAWFHPDVPSAEGDTYASIPESLFSCIEGEDNRGAHRNRVRWFNGSKEAVSALSAACIAWARLEAGLPPLQFLPG